MDVVYIGNDAYKHEADVLRVTPFAAFSGREGIIGSGDMINSEGATPGGFVDISPGVVTVLGRGSGQKYEMYVGKEETQQSVTIEPTDSSGSRTDLVLARVVDPVDGPAGDTPPSDLVNGPYAFYEVIKGVDPSTTKLSDTFAVHGVRAGVALALVTLPASTATVTNSEIADLRRMANALSDLHTEAAIASQGELPPSQTTFIQFPADAVWQIEIPEYATGVDVFGQYNPQLWNGDAFGTARVKLGSNLAKAESVFDINVPTPDFWQGGMRSNIFVAETLPIDEAIRGTIQTVEFQAKANTPAPQGTLKCDSTCRVYLSLNFKQAPVFH